MDRRVFMAVSPYTAGSAVIIRVFSMPSIVMAERVFCNRMI